MVKYIANNTVIDCVYLNLKKNKDIRMLPLRNLALTKFHHLACFECNKNHLKLN